MTDRARSCPLCGSAEADERAGLAADFLNKTYSVVGCDACGVSYTRPVPTPTEMAVLYGSGYYPEAQGGSRLLNFVRESMTKVIQRQNRKLLKALPPGKLLDVGCGAGDFLHSMQERGWRSYGVELSDSGVELSRAKGLDVRQGSLLDHPFPEAFFEAVTMFHVLEHLEDPRADLKEIHRILSDDGVLIIEVPNAASPTLRLLGKSWFGLDLPRHLQHFTPETLVDLLGRESFVPIRRVDYHLWDFNFSFYSWISALGIRERAGIWTYGTDYGRATRWRKLGYLAASVPVAPLSWVFNGVSTLVSGNGETLTMLFRKRNR